jgi:hypothetical protein
MTDWDNGRGGSKGAAAAAAEPVTVLFIDELEARR